MEPLTRFQPATGSLDAWNAAYERVDDYLRAHRIPNRLHRSRLVELILQRAAKRHAADPSAEPLMLAISEANALMDEWFARALGRGTDDRLAAEGRLALLLCDGTSRWPYAFLDTQPPPPEFAGALRQGSIQAGPDMVVSSMVPREIELGAISEAAGETLETLEEWPVLRTLILWAVFAAALAVVFSISR